MLITDMCRIFIVVALLVLAVASGRGRAAMGGTLSATDPTSYAASVQPYGLPTVRVMNDGHANLPNPAAVFCIESGGRYEIRKAADGSQSGVCILSDGRELDAWRFLRDSTNKK